jgi:large subunit ribosomal protein L3
MLGLLGIKLGIMRMYDMAGEIVVTSVIKTGPCNIVQKKDKETDGYISLQIGFEEAKEKRVTKPLLGHFAKANVKQKKHLKEYRLTEDEAAAYELGQELKIEEIFKLDQEIDVTGVSKGKGFAGVIKRHGYSRGPMSHGSRSHRVPGSMGATDAARIFKGKKLPGRMGGKGVTIQNLKIVKIDNEENLLFVTGAIPGAKGSLVSIKPAIKKNN